MLISVVSPVFRAEHIIDELVSRLQQALAAFTEDYEIILVEDGSEDRSWEKVSLHCRKDERIKGIRLSRNFGQHYAISAGIDHSTGTWVVVMDCDLQDSPEEIVRLYEKALEGYDIVFARRNNRRDGMMKRLFSRIFYMTLSYLTGTEQDASIANFGIYHRKVIREITKMRESIRYFPTMVKWVGFSSTKLDVAHSERYEGSTSYSFRKLLHLGINVILAYSDKPLRLFVKFGLLLAVISFCFACFYFFKWLSGSIVILGFTTIIISIWFLSGCILFTIGIAGLYIGKIFEGVKNRPVYITDQKINLDA